MALSAFCGTFTQPNATTGNQAVTGVGFQPKVVIFLYTPLTAAGTAAIGSQCVGWAVDSTHRASLWGGLNDNVAGGTNASRAYFTSRCLRIYTPAGASPTLLATADFVSMDADGFTVNWTTCDATQRLIGFLALGGTDLTNATTGTTTAPTTATTKAITGVGFRPDCILLFGHGSTGAPDDARQHDYSWIGFATAASVGYSAGSAISNSSGSTADRVLKSGSVVANPGAAPSILHDAALQSFDSDGFTLNFTTVDGFATQINYLAIKGARFATASIDQATSAGNQAITGVGYQPSAAVLLSVGAAVNAASEAGHNRTIGFAVSPSQRVSCWKGATSGANPSVADTALSVSKCFITYTQGTPTLVTDADLVSFNADGFTINNTTVDATSRRIAALLIAPLATSRLFFSPLQDFVRLPAQPVAYQ